MQRLTTHTSSNSDDTLRKMLMWTRLALPHIHRFVITEPFADLATRTFNSEKAMTSAKSLVRLSHNPMWMEYAMPQGKVGIMLASTPDEVDRIIVTCFATATDNTGIYVNSTSNPLTPVTMARFSLSTWILIIQTIIIAAIALFIFL